MAKANDHQSAAGATAGRPSLLGRLRAMPGSLRSHPIRSGVAILIGLLMIGGLAVGASVFLTPKEKISPETLLADSLAKLDAGDYRGALQAMGELRLVDEKLAGNPTGLYILGMIYAHDAQDQVSPQQRKTLSAIAARFLDETRLRGFPPDRERQGRLTLGAMLHASHQFAEAIAALREASPESDAELRNVRSLLADCYLQLSPPQFEKALEQNRLLLTLPNVSSTDREQAALQQAQILLALGETAKCHEALASIAAESTLHNEAVLLDTRAALVERQRQASADGVVEYASLITSLEQVLAQPSLPPAISASAELMLGDCQRLSGDATGALQHFSRVRRTYAGSAEAQAAALYAAELEQAAGNGLAAMDLLRRLLQDSGVSSNYHNPWLPLATLDTRVSAAFERMLIDHQYAEAVELAAAAAPLLSEVRSCELAARAEQGWAEHLLATLPTEFAPREVAEIEGQDHLRLAAAQFERLAELRIATRYYPEDLARSAQSYLAGHGYRQAARMYRRLLDQQPKQERPDALTGLGEAQLALNELDAALGTLADCRESYPNHPATYRARLLASEGLAELGRIDEAKQLLEANLYEFALTPQSAEWRDSLFALGTLLYRDALAKEALSRSEGVDSDDLDRRRAALVTLEKAHDRFREAAKTLGEALHRYPEGAQTVSARYQYAECHRHCAKWPRKRLLLIDVETARASLNRQMQQDLHLAAEEYGKLISQLGGQQESQRNLLDRALLRNSYFARGDALFDLGRFEDAIKAYSAATNRYQHEPEALEAYVQIAAAYRRLDRPVEARGTLEQARVVLERMRTDADFVRTTHCTRDEWGQMLSWLATL